MGSTETRQVKLNPTGAVLDARTGKRFLEQGFLIIPSFLSPRGWRLCETRSSDVWMPKAIGGWEGG